MKQVFFFVRLWQDVNVQVPMVGQRVQAVSEVHAVVQLMKLHHLHRVDRAWVSRSAHEEPTVRLAHIFMKGKVRCFKQELGGYSACREGVNACFVG
jgi:hypothetical protein